MDGLQGLYNQGFLPVVRMVRIPAALPLLKPEDILSGFNYASEMATIVTDNEDANSS